MSLSKKSSQINETRSSVPSKATTLNPNAAEFIPFALRTSPLQSGSTSNAPDAAARLASSGTIGKAVLDRSESSASNKSDEEAQQYWRHQLPDDITPDFKVMGDEESQALGGLSLAGLSLHDGAELSRFPASTTSGYVLTEQQRPSPHHINGGSFGEKMRYAASYGEDPASANFLNLPTKPWDKQVVNTDQLLANGGEVHLHPGNSRQGLMNDMLGDLTLLDGMDMNPLEFLALQFPGFAAESLAEVYVANGCDLNHTIEMLTQLELQVDGSFNQNMNSKAFSAPNLSSLDFPALTVLDSHNVPSKFAGNETGNCYQSPDKEKMLLFKSSASFLSRDTVDFASAVRKLASEDSGLWKYERNGSTDFTVGSSRSSHVLAGPYNSGHGRGIYADRLQSRGSAQTPPVWLETGDAVANMYSELREEARDHARLRNAYFEQARQAFLIGNKGLSKELSVKGQLHNMHMKAAHGKAQEAIYRQRFVACCFHLSHP
uniref:Polyadenylate-binding protein-interacting protein 7-like isoform X2 n=1 Tax=Rhizophora mucronata TaxID=61149 RepID=A0A2P2MC09_RHIMU